MYKILKLKSTFELQGRKLTAIPLEYRYPEYTCSVAVTGLPQDVTTAQLGSFFQRHVGGGPVDEVHHTPETCSAVITYNNTIGMLYCFFLFLKYIDI